MELAKISEEYIEEIADSDSIIERGKKYYRTGRVRSLDVKNDKIIAKVIGNYGNYAVNISIDGEEEIDASCNCPYDGYGCKHIVAVLYKWINSDLYGDYSPKKSHNQQGAIERATGIFGNIGFKDIIRLSTLERISAAFKILNESSVNFSHAIGNYLLAEVKNAGIYKVRLHQIRTYNSKSSILKECSCSEFSYDKSCEHILAVLLTILKNKNPDAIPKGYEAKIRRQMNKEKYQSFTDQIETIPAGRQPFRQHRALFNIGVKENAICMSVEKAPMLNNGTLGKITQMSIRFIKENYFSFSDKERKVFDLMFSALNKEGYQYNYYSNSGKAVKDAFSSELDAELLKNLRAICSEEPSRFINCQLPKDKAVAELSIEEAQNNKKSYLLDSTAKFQNKTISLKHAPVFIIGNSSLWVYAKPNLIELEADEPATLSKILGFSGIEMNSRTLNNFVEKHYTKLSEIVNVNLPKDYEIKEINEIIPKPRIYLKDYEGAFCMDLKFLYQAQETAREAHHKNDYDIVFRGSSGSNIIKIRRNKEEELKIVSKLMESSVIKKGDVFLPVGDPLIWLSDAANNLISAGFEIYGRSDLVSYKINYEEPKLTLSVSSGVDWLDLKADVTFGKEKLGFDKIVNALIKHERFVKMSDGSLGMIPKKWVSRLSGIIGFLNKDKENNAYRASRTQMEIVESLLGIAKKSKVDKSYKELLHKFKNFKEIKQAQLPKRLNGQLREYQKAGYNWLNFLREFSFGGCLADEMGLGKTLQVLALLLYEKESGNIIPSLIVVPTSLVFNWIQEVKKFAPFLSVYVHHGSKRLKDIGRILQNAPDLIVTTYATLREDIEMLNGNEYHYIILDESQQIKNPLAKNTKSVYSLKSKYRLVLTGTPVENNYLELWSQFAFLNPGMLGNMEYFRKMFMSESKDKEDKILALKNIISPFILMRKKEMVAKELPQKQITVLYCEMEEKQREIYDYWKDKYKAEILQSIREVGLMKSKIKILQSLTTLRQICNHPCLIDESFTGESGKFNLIISQIEEVISEGHKVLVFSAFVKMLNVFRNYLIKKNIKFSYIYGETKDREGEVRNFQEDVSVQVFLISLKAGGFGLNLTAADYVFIVDPWWNPAVEMQAIDRTHRIGQTKNVFVYKAIIKDSIEEKILELQESKVELVKKVITAEEGIFKKLSQENINYLFN